MKTHNTWIGPFRYLTHVIQVIECYLSFKTPIQSHGLIVWYIYSFLLRKYGTAIHKRFTCVIDAMLAFKISATGLVLRTESRVF